jgi:hypothetical protein
MSSPTARTLAKLRKEGWHAEVVERWNHITKTRKDLWGFADILCVRAGEMLAVQATSYSNISARVRKIADHENVGIVRSAGVRIEVWGWKKSANGRWEVRIVDLS